MEHSSSSSQSFKYGVFLNFRGIDVRKNFVDHFYKALDDHGIPTYKDDQKLPRGKSIGPALFRAIEESRIAITVFSKGYANSAWCLDELAYIIKLRKEKGLIVLPIFYHVDPSQVRSSTGPFGSEFAKQTKKRKNKSKAKSWRKALDEASRIAGWEVKELAGGYEADAIKIIVNAILDTLFPDKSVVDKDLVGMRDRLEDVEAMLDIESGDVRIMLGIWGLGGIGKTTLASSLRKKISQHFDLDCIVMDVRERAKQKRLEKLQEEIILALSKRKEHVQSVDDGKDMLSQRFRLNKVLLVLDDVSDCAQLEALAGKRDWFGNGSRIIVTTRNKELLTTLGVDKTYEATLFSDKEASELFTKLAYNEKQTKEDYEELSKKVIAYAERLPLALKVLGSSLKGKTRSYWIDFLKRLQDTPCRGIIDRLRVSYDVLEKYEQQLFLDIACLWRKERVDDAMEALEACGYHSRYGINVLKQNALISIVDAQGPFSGTIDMHDLVQEMGQYIVTGEHPHSFEKHSRIWEYEKIRFLCLKNDTILKENDTVEAIKFYCFDHDLSSQFCNTVSNMKSLRWLRVRTENKEINGPSILSNELCYLDWIGYPGTSFPDRFQPLTLVVLKLCEGMQKELWKGRKDLPRLKVLHLIKTPRLSSLPDLNGLTCLEELKLECCGSLKVIPESLGKLTSLRRLRIVQCPLEKFPTTFEESNNLERLDMISCNMKDGKILSSIGDLSNLQELRLFGNHFSRLDFSLSKITQLKLLNVSNCNQLLELPDLPSNLAILEAQSCPLLKGIGDCYRNCKRLRQVLLRGSGIVNDGSGSRSLQSMLQGEGVGNECMILELPGVEVAEEFRPALRKGRGYRLQLPDNWRNNYNGFLICAAMPAAMQDLQILMKHETSGNDFKDDGDWEKGRSMGSWVRRISFDLLRATPWWDETYEGKHLDFTVMGCDGVAVTLDRRETPSTTSPIINKYAPQIMVTFDVDDCSLCICLETKLHYSWERIGSDR